MSESEGVQPSLSEARQPTLKERVTNILVPRKDRPLQRRQEVKPGKDNLFPEAQLHRKTWFNGSPFTYHTQSAEGSSEGWSKVLQMDKMRIPIIVNKNKILAWADDSRITHTKLANAEGYKKTDNDTVKILVMPASENYKIQVFFTHPEEGRDGAMAAVQYFTRSLGEEAKNIGINYVAGEWNPQTQTYEEKSYKGPLSDFKDPWIDASNAETASNVG